MDWKVWRGTWNGEWAESEGALCAGRWMEFIIAENKLTFIIWLYLFFLGVHLFKIEK